LSAKPDPRVCAVRAAAVGALRLAEDERGAAHLPIRDVGTPGPEFEEHWAAYSERLRQRLSAGENILVHCRGGLGRAGMVSARLLVESGVEPEAAIERVRAARPGAIETPRQEEWVRSGSPRS